MNLIIIGELFKESIINYCVTEDLRIQLNIIMRNYIKN